MRQPVKADVERRIRDLLLLVRWFGLAPAAYRRIRDVLIDTCFEQCAAHEGQQPHLAHYRYADDERMH